MSSSCSAQKIFPVDSSAMEMERRAQLTLMGKTMLAVLWSLDILAVQNASKEGDSYRYAMEILNLRNAFHVLYQNTSNVLVFCDFNIFFFQLDTTRLILSFSFMLKK